jgi:hypothetical protein
MKYGQWNITMASKNTNAFQFIAWIQTHSRNPWQEVNIFHIYGNGKAQ